MATVLPTAVISAKSKNDLNATYTSAVPVALYLAPWSISTDIFGNNRLTCSADCRANSTLLTMIRARLASGASRGGWSFEIRDTKMVVFPDPVGRETPILEELGSCRTSKHVLRQISW